MVDTCGQLTYPLSFDYVKEWGPWEVIREIVTNALDEDPGFTIEADLSGIMDTGEFAHKVTVISHTGSLKTRHLILGVSDKKDAAAIGQFGEGLKLALLRLTTWGLPVHIYTSDMHLWCSEAELLGERVLQINWEPFGGREGTVITIEGWTHPIYEDRFLRPGDPRIIFTDPFGRSILRQDIPDIFVKGIWVQKAKGYGDPYAYGYDLRDAKMNRDRSTISGWDVNWEIGKIWASVGDADLLTGFWNSVKDRAAERTCSLHGTAIKNPAAVKEAFQEVYGHFAVLETDESYTREAQHRGAETISVDRIGTNLATTVKDLVGTDAEYVMQMEGKSFVRVNDDELAEQQLSSLKLVRRLAKRYGYDGKVSAFVMPDGVEAAWDNNGTIRLSVQELCSEGKSVACLVHELAHVVCSDVGRDNTSEFNNAVAQVAAALILSYARR